MALRVVTCAAGMGRWRPGARERLERAAMELFIEQGFAVTTVQITARAGLTTHTFFRCFTDEREVLFTGEEDLPARVGGFLAGASATLTLMQVVTHGLRAVLALLFEGRLGIIARNLLFTALGASGLLMRLFDSPAKDITLDDYADASVA